MPNSLLRLLSLSLSLSLSLPAADWPEFRGPTAQGHADAATALPLTWSATENVAWKTPIPGAGWSSPVVRGGVVYLTTGIVAGGADAGTSLRALALDAATGRILWNVEVFTPAEATKAALHAKNSPASPTPVVTADRLYVHFGHHGTAALDLAGKILWRNSDFRYDPVHGNGGSPLLADDLLVFSADGARDPAVIALRAADGRLAWKTPRTADVRQKFSFSTPLRIDLGGRPQLVVPGSGAVSALDLRSGRELWHVRYGGGFSVVPRPVFAHGLLFVATGFQRADLLALRADAAASGDLTDTHIAWRTTRGAPLTPSVVVVGDELYAVNDAGLASCWDARTGTLHWQEKIDGNFSASPLAAGDRIYFPNETGTTTVLRAAKTFETLAVNKLDERTLASFAVSGRALFLRTAENLYRFETKNR